jgi:DNA-binding MarR family transcriptional regulator
LGALAAGPLPVVQVARNMGLTRQSVQRTVDVLAEEQLVTFAENPYHQRAKLVRLTERGTEVLEEVARRQAAWAKQLAKDLSPEKVSAAVRLLETVRQRLEPSTRKEQCDGQPRSH